MIITYENDYLMHHGIKGQKWGVRRYQNADGSLTAAGRERYGYGKRAGSAGKVKYGADGVSNAKKLNKLQNKAEMTKSGKEYVHGARSALGGMHGALSALGGITEGVKGAAIGGLVTEEVGGALMGGLLGAGVGALATAGGIALARAGAHLAEYYLNKKSKKLDKKISELSVDDPEIKNKTEYGSLASAALIGAAVGGTSAYMKQKKDKKAISDNIKSQFAREGDDGKYAMLGIKGTNKAVSYKNGERTSGEKMTDKEIRKYASDYYNRYVLNNKRYSKKKANLGYEFEYDPSNSGLVNNLNLKTKKNSKTQYGQADRDDGQVHVYMWNGNTPVTLNYKQAQQAKAAGMNMERASADYESTFWKDYVKRLV